MDGASRLSWPVTQLGAALELLADTSGLRQRSSGHLHPPPSSIEADPDAAGFWIEQASRQIGVEAEAAEIPYNDIEHHLRHAGPALLMVGASSRAFFVALVEAGRRTAILLGRDGRRHRMRTSELAGILRAGLDAPLAPTIHTLLAQAGIADARWPQAARAILRDRFGSAPVARCWLLRLPHHAPFRQHLRQARLTRHVWIVLIALVGHACVWVTSWWIVGRAALEGRFDAAALLVWTLLLLMLVPLSLFGAWSQGVFAIGAGGLLKLRLLSGALRLEPDETRHQGVGQHLARVMECESVETLSLASGFSALATAVELLFAVAIFVAASQSVALALLLVTLFATCALGWVYFTRRRQSTDARRHMTEDLVERMMGHRTRLVQEPRSRWHQGEDDLLAQYVGLSRRVDRIDLALMAVPRCWLIIGMLGLAPSFVMGQTSPGLLAAGLGGVLLAFGALSKLTSTFALIAAAALGWAQITPLLEAARRTDPLGSTDAALASSQPEAEDAGPLVIARDLTFRFHDRTAPILHDCSFRISPGDRIHLSGPSGSGKSTLVSLLTGLRSPASGLLLLDGLDRATVGADEWRRRVVAAPQFHENHVFTETVAFNLLMGRRWPPRPEDLKLAEAVCRRLGLGDVLDRMPGRLFQLLGETGWQLSHGERSRLFMARALLQEADLIVLDESFAELDPESFRQCMSQVEKLSGTLMVVAHT
jgi:ATP-binding cassette, subfamily B, bacterial